MEDARISVLAGPMIPISETITTGVVAAADSALACTEANVGSKIPMDHKINLIACKAIPSPRFMLVSGRCLFAIEVAAINPFWQPGLSPVWRARLLSRLWQNPCQLVVPNGGKLPPMNHRMPPSNRKDHQRQSPPGGEGWHRREFEHLGVDIRRRQQSVP